MVRKSLFFAFLLFPHLFLFSCTGWNYWSGFNPYINTNPTPEYSYHYSLLFKGGYVFHLNHIPGGIGSNAKTLASGSSCSTSILYLFSFGDSSLNSARLEGKITKIVSVDYRQFAILGFVYHQFCTTVTGE